MNFKEWCAMFVSKCYWEAGKPIKHGGFAKGFAGTQTAIINFRKQGWETKTPVHGDIVIFDFNGNGVPEHTGIFEKWLKPWDTFQTIEGNTSTINNQNGGCVMERERQNKNVSFFHIP